MEGEQVLRLSILPFPSLWHKLPAQTGSGLRSTGQGRSGSEDGKWGGVGLGSALEMRREASVVDSNPSEFLSLSKIVKFLCSLLSLV